MSVHRFTATRTVSWAKKAGLGVAASALVLGSGLGALGAQAADGENTIADASLSWRVNDESGGGSFFGGCNFLVAGEAGNTGSSRLWTEGDGFYSTETGNVTITKPDAEGTQSQPTWSTKCKNSADVNVSTAAGSTTGNQVNFAGGTGTVDADADSAEIAWTGSFTIVYYGGLTYWTVNDPVLSVENGVGTLTGVATGYGADMYDPTKWLELEATTITLATFSDVDVTDTGVSINPDYAGVEVEVTPDGPSGEQNRVKDGWGSFPQSWVSFNELTGQAAYWYTSGGQVDVKKTTAPIAIAFTTEAESPVVPEPEAPVAGSGDVEVTIPEAAAPEPEEPTGEFQWEWDSADTISLGTATQQDDGSFTATGAINEVLVTDTRAGGEDGYGWTLNGQVSQFATADNSASFAGTYLGWTPTVTAGDAITAGDAVAAGAGASDGLAESKVLATSSGANSGAASAALELIVPADTAAGNYSATLTITALS